MEKKLIFVDWHLFSRNKNAYLNNLAVLNQIAVEYNSLGIGNLNKERTQEILSNNFRGIENDLSVAVEKEAKHSLTQDFLTAGVFSGFEIFKSKIEHLVSSFDRNQHGTLGIISTPIDFFTIKKGQFVITDEAWERIKTDCSNYIQNEQELKIYEAIEKLAESANKVLDCVGENARLNFFQTQEPVSLIVQNDEGVYIPDNQINFEYLTK